MRKQLLALCVQSPPFINPVTLVASQVSDLESQSELVFEEGLLSLGPGTRQDDEAGAQRAGQEEGQEEGQGVGQDPNLTALWGCYFNWSVERFQDQSNFKTVKKKVK